MTISIPSICVVGSLNVDFVTYTPRCPGAGETLTAGSLVINAGGKGANQAVACGRASFVHKSRQDVQVSMIGAVGANDPHYTTLLQPALEQSGVDTKLVDQRQDDQTGTATVIVESAGGENRILVVPGANHSGMNDVGRILTTIERHQPLPEVVVMQGEIPRATTLGLLQRLNDAACPVNVVFNPAPVFPEGIPLEALKHTAVLVMNETEAVQMIQSLPDVPTLSSKEADLDPESVALQFHEIADVKIVLITLGAKGVYLSTSTGMSGCVQGVRVKTVADTTAAGDTFVGYFATALARHLATRATLAEFDEKIEQAVQAANAAAALCVQRKGAMQSIPFAYETAL